MLQTNGDLFRFYVNGRLWSLYIRWYLNLIMLLNY